MAQIQKGHTYGTADPDNIVSATNIHELVDNATILPGAITDQTELTANQTASADLVLVADASASNALRKVQLANLTPETIRQGVQQYAAGVLGAGVYAVTLSPVATAYTSGMIVHMKADSANSGAVDLNVNALGAKNIFNRAGAELAANDILANQIVTLIYDGTQFLLLEGLSAGEVTATLLAEAARQSIHQYIADSGAANAYVATLSPAATAYTAGLVVRFKATNTNTGAATLNVNGLGAKNLKKTVGAATAALVANDILNNEIVTAIYDGTDFQIRPRSWDYISAATALPGSAAVATFAHGLGFKPTKVRAVLMNNTVAAEQGYAQNDEIEIASVQKSGSATRAFAVSCDATNVYIAQINDANVEVMPRTGGAFAGITEANWALKVYASL